MAVQTSTKMVRAKRAPKRGTFAPAVGHVPHVQHETKRAAGEVPSRLPGNAQDGRDPLRARARIDNGPSAARRSAMTALLATGAMPVGEIGYVRVYDTDVPATPEKAPKGIWGTVERWDSARREWLTLATLPSREAFGFWERALPGAELRAVPRKQWAKDGERVIARLANSRLPVRQSRSGRD